MARFLTDSDYDALMKEEIRRLLDGRAPDGTGNTIKLQAAEKMAIRQITNYLNDRYDCAAIFSKTGDDRDSFIVMIAIDCALYHLYSQTGQRDVPAHRSNRYEDALDWLRMAGRGEIGADLPTYEVDEDETPSVSDLRIISRPADDHEW